MWLTEEIFRLLHRQKLHTWNFKEKREQFICHVSFSTFKEPDLMKWSNTNWLQHLSCFFFLNFINLRYLFPSFGTGGESAATHSRLQFLCSGSAGFLAISQNTQQSRWAWWKMLNTLRMITIMIHISLLLLFGNGFVGAICQMFLISCCRWNS